MDGGPNNVLRPRKQSNQYWEIEKNKSRPQALAKQKNPLVKRPPGRSPVSIQRPQPRLSQLSLLPQEVRQVVHGGQRVRMIRTEVRFAPCKSSAVQGLRLASRDGTGGVGPQARIRLRVPCGKGRKVATALSLDWWKRCQVQLYHVNAHIIQNLKNQTQSSTSWHFNIIWMCVIVVPIFRLQINSNLRVHLFCVFFAKTLWQPQTSQTETCNAASVLCKHLLLNFNMSMFWHVHTWRDLRWFEMICVKLTCSCIIALLHRWQILRWSENVVVFLHFSQLFPTQNAAPSTRHGDFSTAHQRRLAKLPQALQHPRQVVHRGERHAVLGAQLPLVALQASAPQRLRLREGAARLQHPGEPRPWIATGAEKFHGSKSLDPNIFWAVAIGYTYWCCLMLFDAIWCLL